MQCKLKSCSICYSIITKFDVEETPGHIIGDVTKKKKKTTVFQSTYMIAEPIQHCSTLYFILQRKLIWKENLVLLLHLERETKKEGMSKKLIYIDVAVAHTFEIQSFQ